MQFGNARLHHRFFLRFGVGCISYFKCEAEKAFYFSTRPSKMVEWPGAIYIVLLALIFHLTIAGIERAGDSLVRWISISREVRKAIC